MPERKLRSRYGDKALLVTERMAERQNAIIARAGTDF
jgi:hypothetical protein